MTKKIMIILTTFIFVLLAPMGHTLEKTKDIDAKIREGLKEQFPFYHSGFDYDSRPIFCYEIGHWNFSVLSKESDLRVLNSYIDDCNSDLKESVNSSKTDAAVLIYDFEGFNMQHIESRFALKFILSNFAKMEELIRWISSALMINCNFAAKAVLDLARPILGTTMEKVEIFGTNSEHWLPILLRKIPMDQLPQKYRSGR